MLTNLNKKDEGKCNFANCNTIKNPDISICHYCKSYFCINHLRGIIHDCEILYTKVTNSNPYIKSKVNKKIEELEKKRNKKTKGKYN